MTMQATILERIVDTKREEISHGLARCGRIEMAHRARDASPPRGFRKALRRDTVAVIAEIKRASPSAGPIRSGSSAVELGQAYQAGGAAAISVLTDWTYFKGSLDDLSAVRQSVSVPVLRKDFVLDPYQVYEARAAAADAVLLIASILDRTQLCHLQMTARALGMDALVEVHTAEEMETALTVQADLIGINNRDLKTFETRLETTVSLARMAPPDVVLAALSGISTTDDVNQMAGAGVDAILVGESLMRRDDVAAATHLLCGHALDGGRHRSR